MNREVKIKGVLHSPDSNMCKCQTCLLKIKERLTAPKEERNRLEAFTDMELSRELKHRAIIRGDFDYVLCAFEDCLSEASGHPPYCLEHTVCMCKGRSTRELPESIRSYSSSRAHANHEYTDPNCEICMEEDPHNFNHICEDKTIPCTVPGCDKQVKYCTKMGGGIPGEDCIQLDHLNKHFMDAWHYNP